MAKLSPMMEQYFRIKENHKDHILFFRLGDFYEMFFDDAKLASKELDLTLTGRDCGQEERAPMCGIPFHSCDGYIQRLIQKGYKVAICEQIEDPAMAKGIVKRDVTRVITPGTLIEAEMLDESKNNFLCCIFEGKSFGLSFADVSTGEIYLTEISKDSGVSALLDEIAGFMPAEIIMSPSLEKNKLLTEFINHKLNAIYTLADEYIITNSAIDKKVFGRFKNSDNQKKLKSSFACVCCLCMLIDYVENTQKNGLQLLEYLNFYNESQFMQLGITTRTNLEISQTIRTKEKRGSLLWVLDKTKTSMGRRLLKREIERPLLNIYEIQKRLDGVEILAKNNILLDCTEESLSGIYDIERLLSRIVYGSVNAREIKSLQYTIEKFPKIKEIIKTADCEYFQEILADIDDLDDIRKTISDAIEDNPPISVKEGNIFKKGYNSQVDELRDILDNGKGYLAMIEAREKEKTGIKNLKISYNRVFGYYLEVTKSFLNLVPDYFIRKQTLANNERFITDELKELENKILGANDKIIKLEYDLFSQLRYEIAKNVFRIEKTAKAIAKLDFVFSLAKVATENNYTKPIITQDNVIDIKDGRHPVVEKFSKRIFVSNDAFLNNEEHQLLIITGPNMAGKSTYMRQIALIVIMAQLGSFVPCSYAKIGLCDKIFTRIGASDDLSAGQSTFMVEMSELANILDNATQNSLIILDEIGRGTSTFDGMSIAKSVIEYITSTNGNGSKTLFATHYHELTELENTDEKVKNYNIAVKKRGDEITFLRRIIRGAADDSYGIEVAKLAGVPEAVVMRAKEILHQIENNSQNNEFVCHSKEIIKQQESLPPSIEMEILNELKATDMTTITPIEAMNILYNAVEKLKFH